MNIVFDIDDTIIDETGFILKEAPAYLKKKYGMDAKVVNPNGKNVAEIFGLYEFFKSKDSTLSEEELTLKCKKAIASYNAKMFLKYSFQPLRPDASNIINDLTSRGYKITFVSLRGIKTKEEETIKDVFLRKVAVPLLTKLQLKLNDIKYKQLVLVEKVEDKKQIIADLKPSFVFEDTIEVINDLSDIDTIPVCVETPHNVLEEFENERVVRVPFTHESVMEVVNNAEKNKLVKKPKRELTKKEKNKRKIKSLKMYQKFYTENFYKLIRVSAKIYSKVYDLNPLIIGEENIPKEKGPDVFVSNHRNIKDPLITMALLKHPTHFAALKRMFENNENIFGTVGNNLGTYATTFLVKSAGALPIARPEDTDYMITNLQTFKYINDYLAAGSATAIYPEGTINRKPDENGNILPLKSNQAFKIAEDGKGVVRPIAMVWVPKEVDIPNRVIIAFLKPIYTEGLKASEIAQRWTTSVNNAINGINTIIEELVKINTKKDDAESVNKVKVLSQNIRSL